MLGHNKLLGEIPKSLYKLTALSDLRLNSNSLSGTLADQLRNFDNMGEWIFLMEVGTLIIHPILNTSAFVPLQNSFIWRRTTSRAPCRTFSKDWQICVKFTSEKIILPGLCLKLLGRSRTLVSQRFVARSIVIWAWVYSNPPFLFHPYRTLSLERKQVFWCSSWKHSPPREYQGTRLAWEQFHRHYSRWRIWKDGQHGTHHVVQQPIRGPHSQVIGIMHETPPSFPSKQWVLGSSAGRTRQSSDVGNIKSGKQ